MPTLAMFMLGCAALTTALTAGLLYAYACSVNPGLHRLSDTAYVAAMQSINAAIQNPLFFACFMGAPFFLIVSTWLQYSQPLPMRFWLLLSATLLYLIGTMGVTILGNVPLNNMLASVDLTSASSEALAAQRANFEIPWNRLHTVRTVAAVIATVLVIAACMNPKAES